MKQTTPIERGAQEVRSLLLEGYIYVGKIKRKDITSFYLRHPNGNRARIDIDDTARLYINSKIRKIL